MDIMIEELRIRNYKCHANTNIKLNESNLLLGANNVGKTALLEALELCFTRFKKINEELVYISKNEPIDKNKEIIIDVLIKPANEESFGDMWFELFGNFIFENENCDFVALRTVIKYNELKGEYELERKALNSWSKIEDVVSYDDFSSHRVTKDILDSIPVFYLDAKRDITTEMTDKFSYWGKLIKDINLSTLDLSLAEQSLNDINDTIVSQSDVLNHLSSKLNTITKVVGENNQVEINPVSRKIKDLSKGMEIRFNDAVSESFPISNLGMGTRSWATFLTLSAYIDWRIKEMTEKDMPFHPILLLEEPEAHLHPQAQRKIYSQMRNLTGQKFISTHSPIIAAQAELRELLHIIKTQSFSEINHLKIEKLSPNEQRKIKEEVFKTRGDILFSNILILCEGETEDQVLPQFFKHHFNAEPFEMGVNIVSSGGSGKYKPFLQIAYDLGIKLYILSDGEKQTIREVKKHYQNVFSDASDEEIQKHIKFLPNGADFEKYLIDENYIPELLDVVKEISGNENYIEAYITKKNGTKGKPSRTNKKCEKCNQHIFEQEVRDYSGDEGFKQALLKYLSDNKTEYASLIADKILQRKSDSAIPKMIQELFNELPISKITQ